ncbi:phosphatase PAP2 family protein [Trichocoleus sp. DQ-U1]|uniref:phosphatase PAP2 family protein n=1 Tax=Trichocoleus sp. DQ-U1 TaxID=2933926 RepID=UPI003299EA57
MFSSNFWKLPSSFLSFLEKLLVAYWRSLLLLLIGVCLPMLVFEELALVVLQNQGGLPWDETLLLAVHKIAQPQVDVFAATLTKFGVFWGVFPVATVISLVLLRLKKWRSLAYLLTTLLGSILINRTAKLLLHRVRPNLWESISPEFDYAFPSGHAMSSMTLIAALVILTWNSNWCWLVLAVGSVFVLAIGWTRIYLGVHFPSDILAGWMVSIAWSIGVSLLIQPHLTKPSTIPEDELTVDEEESIAQG